MPRALITIRLVNLKTTMMLSGVSSLQGLKRRPRRSKRKEKRLLDRKGRKANLRSHKAK